MCISPMDMSNEQLQEEINGLQRYIDSGSYSQYHDMYRRRIEGMEALLKERAEDGTYADH